MKTGNFPEKVNQRRIVALENAENRLKELKMKLKLTDTEKIRLLVIQDEVRTLRLRIAPSLREARTKKKRLARRNP